MSSPRDKGRLKGGFVPWPNQIQDASLAFGFTKREGAVVQAIGRKTYGWRKKKDRISYLQVATMTGLHARNVAQVMRNLRRARVLTCEGDFRGGSVLVWGIQEQTELWDGQKLMRLRSAGRKKSSAADGDLQDAGGDRRPRVEIALPPRAKTALGTQGQNSPTQQTLLQTRLQTNRAAGAAVSLSHTREGGERGLVETPDASTRDARAEPDVGPSTPSEEQRRKMARFCAELERADLNPYPWLARKHDAKVPVPVVIDVLEEATRQKAAIRDFWPWAQEVLRKVRERERLDLAERGHEARKREFAESAGAILERVALVAQRGRRGEQGGDS